MSHPVFAMLLRFGVAGWLAYAGATKLMAPRAFLTALEAYPWLPQGTLVPLTWGVPGLEVVVAVSLITGWGRRGAWLWAVLLGVAFVASVGAAWALGLQISCGCFGESTEPITGWSVARSGLFLGLAVLGALSEHPRARRAGSLHRRG